MKGTAEPEAAVAIVCATQPEKSVLLIRRSVREDDPWSGHWSFPGGRRDPQDIDLLHTALRELEEECSIGLKREQKISELPAMLARRRTGPFLLVVPFVFAIEGQANTTLDPREAVEALWISRSLLVDPMRHRLLVAPGRPSEMRFPGIVLDGAPLWGFTYRVITDWLELTPKHPHLEQAGFDAACLVLNFLVSHGLTLKQGWVDRPALTKSESREVVKVATVEGEIPTNLVLDRFCVPNNQVPNVNLLEVRPECIRVIGLAFEEYLICAS